MSRWLVPVSALIRRACFVAAVLGLSVEASSQNAPPVADAIPAKPTFTKDVLPILQAHCQDCHRFRRPVFFRCACPPPEKETPQAAGQTSEPGNEVREKTSVRAVARRGRAFGRDPRRDFFDAQELCGFERRKRAFRRRVVCQSSQCRGWFAQTPRFRHRRQARTAFLRPRRRSL